MIITLNIVFAVCLLFVLWFVALLYILSLRRHVNDLREALKNLEQDQHNDSRWTTERVAALAEKLGVKWDHNHHMYVDKPAED